MQKVVVVQPAILVQVKVLNHRLKIVGLEFSEAVFSLEQRERVSIDETIVLSVDSLKRRIRLKVSHGCQNLPDFFDRNLLLSTVNKDFFEFKSGFVSKHLSSIDVSENSGLLTFY